MFPSFCNKNVEFSVRTIESRAIADATWPKDRPGRRCRWAEPGPSDDWKIVGHVVGAKGVGQGGWVGGGRSTEGAKSVGAPFRFPEITTAAACPPTPLCPRSYYLNRRVPLEPPARKTRRVPTARNRRVATPRRNSR